MSFAHIDLRDREDINIQPKKDIFSLILMSSIDYRWEIGRFPVFASFVTISNPDSLSSSETRIRS